MSMPFCSKTFVLFFIFAVSNCVANELEGDYVPGQLLILLENRNGTPTPQGILKYFEEKQSLPPGLGLGSPFAIDFVLKNRGFAIEDKHHPAYDKSKGRVYRYMIFSYPLVVNIDALELTLQNNPHVRSVEKNYKFKFSVTPSDGLFSDPGWGIPADYQWGSYALNLPSAWDYQKGHAYVGILDNGIQVDHPDLRAFDENNNYVGGNFRPYLSWDFRNSVGCETDRENCVDEATTPGAIIYPSGTLYAGHGTHVAGIIGATANSNPDSVAGACWNCSLLINRVWTSYDQIMNGIDWQIANGAQVISMSFSKDEDCTDATGEPRVTGLCDSINNASERNIFMVAASGNDKADIAFPASDDRVIAVGGIEFNGDLWDRNPNNLPDVCPDPSTTEECGSNYTVTEGSPRQDVVAPARDVLSTFYTQSGSG